MLDREYRLAGGNVTPVVRIGQTVRRTACNPAFQRMLAEGHLDHYQRELGRLRDSLPLLM